MTTKELLEDIKKRGVELSEMCEKYRDMHKEGTAEYAFRNGQATTWANQVCWAEDMLDVYFPSDNVEARQNEAQPRS